MFFKVGVLKSFANLTGKHLYWSHFLKNFQAEGMQLYLKKTPTRVLCFPVKFVKCLTKAFFTEHLR